MPQHLTAAIAKKNTKKIVPALTFTVLCEITPESLSCVVDCSRPFRWFQEQATETKK